MWLTHFVCKLHARSSDFYLSPRFCLSVAHRIRGKFPKGSSLHTEFGSWISSRCTSVSFSFHPETLQLLFRASLCVYTVAQRAASKKGLRIEFDEDTREGEGKYPECGGVIWWRARASRRGVAVTAAASTLPAEFYEGIYMSAIFYGALNARSRSVPHCRGGRLWIKVRFKDFFLIPRRGG